MNSVDNFIVKFITILTSICWWFEVRFNKNSVFVGGLFSFFIIFLHDYFVIAENKNMLIDISVSMLISLYHTSFNYIALNILGFVKRSKISPNANIKGIKVLIIVWCVMACLVIFFENLNRSIPLFALLIYAFILCSEVISPKEKEERRARNENAKYSTQTSNELDNNKK